MTTGCCLRSFRAPALFFRQRRFRHRISEKTLHQRTGCPPAPSASKTVLNFVRQITTGMDFLSRGHTSDKVDCDKIYHSTQSHTFFNDRSRRRCGQQQTALPNIYKQSFFYGSSLPRSLLLFPSIIHRIPHNPLALKKKNRPLVRSPFTADFAAWTIPRSKSDGRSRVR